jgi:hypothetical protein
MAEMLLINPRRRKARKATRRSAAQRRATAKLVAMSRRRRRNPSPARAIVAANPRKRRMARRRNPVAVTRRVMRRRRNPSMRFSFGGVIGAIQNAAIQGAGAVAFDLIHGQIQRFLPAMLVPVAGRVGLGDLVKASLTVFLGQALNGPTRGLSSKAATGALTVQAHALIRSFVPSSMPLGYASAGMVGTGSARIGPNRAIVGMGRYTRPGATQLLNSYVQPGATPLLNGSRARMREGIAVR